MYAFLLGGMDVYYKGIGCKKCRNTGYSGRIAIHELFVPDDKVLELINENASFGKIRESALKNGMISLFNDGVEKAKAGIVSAEEVLRIAQ